MAIYLDNAATTPVDPRVVAAMLPYLQADFGNPASGTHGFGLTAARAVERARVQVATLVNATPGEIAWTSGATESNNLAIKGAASAHAQRGKHLVTVATEHKAVLDTMHWLGTQGYSVTFLAPETNGLVSPETFAAALRDDTVLASVMLVNNEIGVIQDIATLGKLCRERGVLFHVDAAQATGKVAIDLATLPVDLMSLTAHKTYGPKGIGALYVRSGVKVDCQMHGGGHERGLRSGTLPTHQIVGLGECFALAQAAMAAEVPRIRAQRDRLWAALREIEGVRLNGDFNQRIAHNLNLTLAGCELPLAELTEVAVSSASACIAGQASHVIATLGNNAEGTVLRITVGRFNSDADIDFAAQYLRSQILRHCTRKAA
ncbi:MAG: aminotransferase class V-fold PLP-dependent enzyme [Betaproteobacteria bacterium]|nr:aminotransferase class V-fold PLP-dependent enzyme [Betaproteobacteria bacterium]